MIYKKLVVVVTEQQTIKQVVKEMDNKIVYAKGIAIIVNKEFQVLGVFNDGDLIRLVSEGVDLNRPISEVMTSSPVVVDYTLSHQEIINSVENQLKERGINSGSLRDVILVNEKNELKNVLNFVELIVSNKGGIKNVAVFGQGFVGITLSAALANVGHKVYGVDVNKSLIEEIRKNNIHVFEPGLNDIVEVNQKNKNLSFHSALTLEIVDYYIVAVGTPVNDLGEANLDYLESVLNSIGERLKRGDVVILRSTVPVGTTRNFVLNQLEDISGLKAGADFYLSFAPERTAEGKAMMELRSLPQIVGGYTDLCSRKSTELWRSLTDSVIQVESLEGAEMVKLVNNSFRDLSFAFANSVALLADRFNINSFKLLSAANEGYPRNTIPLPSPGVGGYCLTKDPFLFASIDPKVGHAQLAVLGRKVNHEAQEYVIKQVKKYTELHNLKMKGLKVMIVGLAFKGWPETNDLRGSSSVFVAKKLLDEGVVLSGFDHVVPHSDWQSFLPITESKFPEGLSNVDVVLFMNNHPRNIPKGLSSFLKEGRKMVFDGWSMLDAKSIAKLPNVTYATMGYMSN